MQIELVRPGPDGLEWLRLAVAREKAGAPFDPVTLVVSNHVQGRFVERYLGRSQGYVNLRALLLGQLAVGVLGGPAYASTSLTPALELGAARSALEQTGGGLRALAHHYPLYRELLRLFRELRRQELSPAVFANLSGVSEATSAAAETFAAFRELTLAYPDTTEVRRLAAEALPDDGAEAPPLLREIGPVLVYLPTRLDPVDVRLLAKLARWVNVRIALSSFGDPTLLGDEDSSRMLELLVRHGAVSSEHRSAPQFGPRGRIRVVRAPDPAEEIREVVRRVVAELERGVPLFRQAILYRQADPYAVLVRETLDGAGLAWNALDGQPLSETLPGRAFLSVLKIGQTDFARESVLGWLTTVPERASSIGADSSEWDRLSRDANVVRGTRQWQHRLEVYATEIERQAQLREHEGSLETAGSLRSLAARARTVVQTVLTLAEALQPPPSEGGWQAFVEWAEELRVRFGSSGGSWQAPHNRASELIQTTLAELTAADRFTTHRPVTLADFLSAFEAALADRSVTQGKLGVGVVVGPVQSATGFAFDRVYLVGLVEGAFPPSPAADPFFPDESQDPLNRAARARSADRRAFLSALAAADGGEVTLGVPESAGGRAVFPSRWLLELADDCVGGTPLDAQRFRRLAEATHPWLRIVHSTLDGVHRSAASTDLGERRLEQAAAWRRAGRYLGAHALGRRADLPLAAGLEFARRKQSNAFTEFDGNLGTLTTAARLVGFIDGQRVLSPTSLEVWAACPYRFFLESVLRVAPTHDPEEQWTIDAAEKGSLIHDVLERFFSELNLEGRPGADEAYTSEDFARLERVARDRLSKAEDTGDAGHPLVWEATRREVLADLRTFLDRDTEWRRSHRMQPTYFEKAFGDGHEWPAVEVSVRGGILRLRGRMDRVDVSPNGQHAYVFDYKTGSASRYSALVDPIEGGKRLQLAIYSRAVQQALGDTVRTGAAYWFISSRGEFKRIPLPHDEAAVSNRLDQGLALIAHGITSGVFPAVPGSDDYLEDRASNCEWCPYDTVCPASRDQDWQRKQADGCASFISLSELSATGSPL